VRLLVGVNIIGLNSVVFSVVDDIPVDSETHVVTLSISRIYKSVFKDDHRLGLGLRSCVHRGECAYVVSVWVVL